MDLYIGLMSGTSADGIDAVLVDFSQTYPNVIAAHYVPYAETIREQIFALRQTGADEIQHLGELDITLGKIFAQAVTELLKKQNLTARDIKAIGSHGQTIRHFPHHPHRFTLQIGDPNTIAELTGITTVADFRRKDVALGGQGAPLVPAFHHYVLASATTDRAIVNIGGIANITILPKNNTKPIIGFDTGPGNALLDEWIYLHKRKRNDENGDWAASGKVDFNLLVNLTSDPYFQIPPPKSTGREYFNLNWLKQKTDLFETSPKDIQTTLVEFTAVTILNAIRSNIESGDIIACGGGVHNHFLMQRLENLSKPHFTVSSSEKFGIHPTAVEATAFAWLAKQTMQRQPGNLPSVTGAKKAAILGGIYYAD